MSDLFYQRPANRYLRMGNPFDYEGNQYPANWIELSTPEEKAELGLEEVITTNSPADQRYYWVSEELDGAELTYINTPKDLDPCKETAISQTNAVAYSLLSPSDWMVTRQVEASVPVLPEWTTYREAVRTTANQAKAEYTACSTVDEIAAVVIEWPTSPDTPVNAEPETIGG